MDRKSLQVTNTLEYLSITLSYRRKQIKSLVNGREFSVKLRPKLSWTESSWVNSTILPPVTNRVKVCATLSHFSVISSHRKDNLHSLCVIAQNNDWETIPFSRLPAASKGSHLKKMSQIVEKIHNFLDPPPSRIIYYFEFGKKIDFRWPKWGKFEM